MSALRVADWRHWALCVLAGLALAGAQAPLQVWPLMLLGFALALWLSLRATSLRRAALSGWVIGTSYFAVTLSWIVEPFLVDIARHGWMAPFALLLMAGGLALFWAAAFWGAARLHRPAALIALWPLADYARSTLFTGFPWALTAYGWIDTPLAQTAAWLGPHGLGAATLALVALPVLWRPALGAAVALSGFGGLAALGCAHLASAPQIAANAPVVRLTQPNAPQHQKWDRDFIPVFFQRQLAATRATPRPDLILWPETSLPNWLNDAETTLEVMAEAAAGAPILVGAQRYAGGDVYNSLALIDPEGRVAQVYDKHHLVPFGEYVPLAPLLGRLGLSTLTDSIGGFSAGPGARLLDLGPLGRALPLICYEAVFPHQLRAPGGRADVLLHLTNDAWFGTRSGPYQHLIQARFRAIEQGLPLLRSANTGISAAIDAQGRVLDSLPLGTAGYLDTRLPPARAATLYTRFGDIPALIALAFLLCATLLPQRARRD